MFSDNYVDLSGIILSFQIVMSTCQIFILTCQIILLLSAGDELGKNKGFFVQKGLVMEELSNKNQIYTCNMSLRMMKLASKIGCASEIFSLAMLYYKNYQHEQSLWCTQTAQERFSKPYVIFYMYHYALNPMSYLTCIITP